MDIGPPQSTHTSPIKKLNLPHDKLSSWTVFHFKLVEQIVAKQLNKHVQKPPLDSKKPKISMHTKLDTLHLCFLSRVTFTWFWPEDMQLQSFFQTCRQCTTPLIMNSCQSLLYYVSVQVALHFGSIPISLVGFSVSRLNLSLDLSCFPCTLLTFVIAHNGGQNFLFYAEDTQPYIYLTCFNTIEAFDRLNRCLGDVK